jgi:poly(3-hydroxybutyrate) depolymerase
MYYQMFELSHAALGPARAIAETWRLMLDNPLNPMRESLASRRTTAALEVFERTTRRYEKPAFNLPTTVVDGRQVAVTEQVVWEQTFCKLVHFRRDVPKAVSAKHPRILLVAPVSGHYATLLRGTVETFLPDHDVYITDWVDARQVPVSAGTFDLDDYIDTLRSIFTFLQGDVHVFAVCQPSVPVLAAVTLMEAAGDPNVPRSMTLAGGPIDTRVSPTAVNELAETKKVDWFRRNVINTVPWPHPGRGRQVYPGFLQLSGFMTMNLDRHMKAHTDLFRNLVDRDDTSVEHHKEFYDEYLAVMDLTAEFYMQTIERVFVNHELPRGLFKHRGKPVDVGQIKRVALMTVEGENDDITGKGQCSAAIDLCRGLPAAMKQHFECPRVGHYGVFNGSRFRSDIAPRMRHFMRRFDPRTAAATPAEYKPKLVAVPGGKPAPAAKPDLGAEGSAFSFQNSAARAQSAPPSGTNFDPFAPFVIFTTANPLRLWSMTTDAMLSGWSRLNGGAVVNAIAQKPD